MLLNRKKGVLLSFVVVGALFLCLSCDLNQLPDPLDDSTTGRQQPADGSSADSKNGSGVSSGAGSGVGATSDSENGAGTAAESTATPTASSPGSNTATSSTPVDFSKIDWSKKITIKFDPGDGHYVSGGTKSPNAEVVETWPGELIRSPANPWKFGCRFDGWYFDYGTWQKKWDPSTRIYESVRLSARFVESDNPDPDPMAGTGDQQSGGGTGSSSSVESGYVQHGNGLRYPTALYDMGREPHVFGKTTELWARGVDWNGGWTDNPQYTNNCWGTTSSQMLDWYFKQPENKGLLVNSDAPKTVGEMRDYFFGHRGIQPWYINSALDLYLGRYFPEHKANHVYYGEGNNALSLETLSALCYEHLSKGDVGGLMGVTTGNPHAMTLWGAEFDADGLVTALYLTTSECTENEEVLKPRINKYTRCESPEGLGEGHYGWKTTYYITTAGYTSGFTTSVCHIYGLHFLSVAD